MSAPEQRPPLSPLITARQFAREMDDTVTRLVVNYKRAGYSWEDIGAALGISRQGAHQRYGSFCRAAGLPEEAGDVPAQQ